MYSCVNLKSDEEKMLKETSARENKSYYDEQEEKRIMFCLWIYLQRRICSVMLKETPNAL